MIIKLAGQFLLLLSMLLTSSCVTVPGESSRLSSELGQQLTELEKSHLSLLNKYFEHKKLLMDRFIEEEWLPVFAEKFYSQRDMANAWDTVVRENNKAQRLKFVVFTGVKLNRAIYNKRMELIQPMEALHLALQEGIKSSYTQAKAINHSITSYLVSASKLDENRNRYLQKLGLNDSKVSKVLDKTDDIVADLLKVADKVDSNAETIEKYRSKLEELRHSF